jgi:predicted deacylase
LSCLYALLDCSPVVAQRHLTAALAVWKYCEDSARFIFGDAIGDPTADRILQALRTAAPEGLTRMEVTALFDRHKSSQDITRALNVLQGNGVVRSETEQTGGRPTERWHTVS